MLKKTIAAVLDSPGKGDVLSTREVEVADPRMAHTSGTSRCVRLRERWYTLVDDFRTFPIGQMVIEIPLLTRSA